MQNYLRALAKRDVKILRHRGVHIGLSAHPSVLHGNTSLAQILSIIPFTGARRAVLLGADMRDGAGGKTYWFGDRHPWQTGAGLLNYAVQQWSVSTMAEPLRRLGIEVVNCSPGSALRCFERRPLDKVIGELTA
jgi:hypothetical protein